VKAIVVGIGNPILRDDSVGIKVVERVKERIDVETAVLTTTGFDVLDKILDHDFAIIVDAIRTGNRPGTIYELSVEEISLTDRYTNSHNLNLATTLKLGYTIFPERMPEVRILAVEVEDVESFGEDCTPEVEKAIPKVVERIEEILKSLRTPPRRSRDT